MADYEEPVEAEVVEKKASKKRAAEEQSAPEGAEGDMRCVERLVPAPPRTCLSYTTYLCDE